MDLSQYLHLEYADFVNGSWRFMISFQSTGYYAASSSTHEW